MPKIITDTLYVAMDLKDRYELPFAVGGSPKEIAEILGLESQSVRYGLSKQGGIFRNLRIKIEAVKI